MIGSIRIKEATIEDLLEIWVLEKRCFRDQALSLDELHGLYQSLNIKFFIARDRELLGYAIGGVTGEDGKLYSLGSILRHGGRALASSSWRRWKPGSRGWARPSRS